MIKISVNTDISLIGFYGYIGKISVNIFIKISVRYIYIYIKFEHLCSFNINDKFVN